MSTQHDTCAFFEDALISGALTHEQQAHAASCERCQGVIAMTTSIKNSLAEVPLPPGQQPQWISELHARSARRRKRLAWAGAGLSLAAAAALAVWFAVPSGDAPPRSAVKLDKPIATHTGSAIVTPARPKALLAAGYLAVRDPIVLTGNGRVTKLDVKNGDRITKGQILVGFDDGLIRAELGRENARVRDATRNVDRMRKLVRAQAATQYELDKAIGALELASADARVVAQRLKEAAVRSPIDGTVLEVLAHPGEALRGDAPVVRVADLSVLVAEVNIAEADLVHVYVGQSAEVTTDAQRDVTYQGKVRDIAPTVDRARGTVLVKVDLESTLPPSNLRPNMAVQVRLMPRATAPVSPTPDAPGRPAWITKDKPFSSWCTMSAPMSCIGISSLNVSRDEAKQEAADGAIDAMLVLLGEQIEADYFEKYVKPAYAPSLLKGSDRELVARRRRVVEVLNASPAAGFVPSHQSDWHWEQYQNDDGSTSFLVFVRYELGTPQHEALLQLYSSTPVDSARRTLPAYPLLVHAFDDFAGGDIDLDKLATGVEISRTIVPAKPSE